MGGEISLASDTSVKLPMTLPTPTKLQTFMLTCQKIRSRTRAQRTWE